MFSTNNDLEAAQKRQRVSESMCRQVENEDYIPRELAFLLKRKITEPSATLQLANEQSAEASVHDMRRLKSLPLTPSTSQTVLPYQCTGSSHLSMYPTSSFLPMHIGILHRAKWVDEFNSTFNKVRNRGG